MFKTLSVFAIVGALTVGAGSAWADGTIAVTINNLSSFTVGVPVSGTVVFTVTPDATNDDEAFDSDIDGTTSSLLNATITQLPAGVTAKTVALSNSDLTATVTVSGTPTAVGSNTSIVVTGSLTVASNVLVGSTASITVSETETYAVEKGTLTGSLVEVTSGGTPTFTGNPVTAPVVDFKSGYTLANGAFTITGYTLQGTTNTVTGPPSAVGTYNVEVTITGDDNFEDGDATITGGLTIGAGTVTAALINLSVPVSGQAISSWNASKTALDATANFTVQSVTFAGNGAFVGGTSYTATIVLAPKANYTFTGFGTSSTGFVAGAAAGTIGPGGATYTFTADYTALHAITISAQPATNVSIPINGTTALSVTAIPSSGTPAFTYAWFKGTVASPEVAGNAISGATSATYTTPASDANQIRTNYYYVTVSATNYAPVTSRLSVVNVEGKVQGISVAGTATISSAAGSTVLTASIIPTPQATETDPVVLNAKWEVLDPVTGLTSDLATIDSAATAAGVATVAPAVVNVAQAKYVRLRAANIGNGTVRVVAKSLETGSEISGSFTVTITGQRNTPQGFAVLAGLHKTTNAPRAVLSWSAPTSGGGTITGYQVSSGSGFVTASSATGHTFENLPSGSTSLGFSVRAVYSGSVDAFGPAVSVTATIPTVRSDIQTTNIVWNAPSAGLTFNRSAQNIGRATIMRDNNYTDAGKDLFDTLYTYAGTAADGTTLTAEEPKSFAEAKAPVKAGTYTAVVVFRNSRFEGTKNVTFKIAPKALTAAMLTLQNPMPTYTYDGDAKTPSYSVVDVDALDLGTDFEGVTTASNVYANNTNAGSGTAAVSIKGINNYSGAVSKTFNINKKSITLDTLASTVADKVYDGTVDVKVDDITVAFTGLIGADAANIELGKDYTITNAKFTNANVSTVNNAVTATVSLIANGPVAKNYLLSSTPAFRKIASVTQLNTSATHVDSIFTYAIPQGHLVGGSVRGIGAVTFRSPLADATCTLRVVYTVGAGDSSGVPNVAGTYPVKVLVRGKADNTSNFTDADVSLGSYEIGAPLKPEISDQATLKDTTVRQNKPLTLTVTAVSPNDGTLSYQWYRNDTLITGARNASYNPSTAVVGSEYRYFVQVTNSKANVQIPDSIVSNVATVRVLEPAKSLVGAVVSVGGEYTYNGAAQEPSDVTVTLAGATLTRDSDYEVTFSQNVNAGRALVTVKGLDAYENNATGTFTIAQKTLELSDLSYVATSTYNTAAQPLNVIVTGGRTGLGVVTVRYWTDSTTSSTTAPTDAGDYEVTITVAKGLNFTASDTVFNLGVYTILPKVPTASDFTFTIPTNHKFTGQAQGIGAVTMKGTGYGEIAVLYDGLEDLPVEIGTYTVTVDVTGGNNYLGVPAVLGEYTIADTASSVASNDRVIPGGKNEVTVVAPVTIVAGEFTAGPNPAAKASGKVAFFWQGRAVANGTLYVFDAFGNLVKKVPVSDKGVGADRREIGSWNLTDAKGAPVAEGTYLVKGALAAKDGSKVKVSKILGVR